MTQLENQSYICFPWPKLGNLHHARMCSDNGWMAPPQQNSWWQWYTRSLVIILMKESITLLAVSVLAMDQTCDRMMLILPTLHAWIKASWSASPSHKGDYIMRYVKKLCTPTLGADVLDLVGVEHIILYYQFFSLAAQNRCQSLHESMLS